MISLESSYVCNQDVQWSIELAVKVIHSSFAAQQQSGNVQIGKLADIVRVEIINWCLCVQSQVQQRLPTTQPRIHLHKNSDGVLNIHQFLGSNETSVPFQYLCNNCDEIEACYHVQFEIHLKINEIRTHKVKEVFWRAHPREERKEREREITHDYFIVSVNGKLHHLFGVCIHLLDTRLQDSEHLCRERKTKKESIAISIVSDTRFSSCNLHYSC